MKNPKLLFAALLSLSIAPMISAQVLAPDLSLSFGVTGSFSNPDTFGSRPRIRIDNNLTNGYVDGFDNHLGPAITNLVGAAAFQWGRPAKSSAFPHASALWFAPEVGITAIPEEHFTLGFLYYRNGTILADSGALGVDFNLSLGFSPNSSLATQNTSFRFNIIDTLNNDDPIASADIIQLNNHGMPLSFTDEAGNQYFLELSFRVDENTLNNTLSTPSEFRVKEGGVGSAELVGRLTVTPIPEPGSAALLLLGLFSGVLRRRRK
jgi:hypothetical protein